MAASDVVFVTITDRTTVAYQPTSFATQVSSSAAPAISSSITSVDSSLISSPTGSPIDSLSFTTLAPSSRIPVAPSSTSTAVAGVSVLPNNTVAEIVLACIILISILFIGMMALGLLLWFRGRCPHCSDIGPKRLEAGTEKRITVDMVRARESRQQREKQRQSMPTVSDRGISHGQSQDRHLQGQSDYAQAQHRAVALNNLNETRPTRYKIHLDGNGIRETLWPGGVMEDDVSIRAPTPGPESGLGHGNPPPPASSLYTASMLAAPAPAHHTGLAASYYNPRISYGASATDRYGARAPTPIPEPVRIMESIPSNDPEAQAYRNAAAAASDPNNPDAEDAKAYADRLLLNIREREKKAKTKRTYADMPDPDDFEDVDLGGSKSSKWKMRNPIV
ncbi:hypothetical protein K491DRAFT_102309 [Lophiostoma macrostomum CBS 122681]|uniref:Uncharacterized protein n=1 Tax=Lophiostoma macrostomum CBS 122681 TaxID=1314788 RepID=A0A6A6STX6_9PLEO|nr:hypothetical protein K491DRAFT_102309 [Lophiostoma macrostomum CBS 122681]